MPSYWFLDSDGFFEKREELVDTELMVDAYDFSRAKALLARVNKLNAVGPILVAWERPFDARKSGADALVFDLSKFADEDLDRALQIWTTRIARDPDSWNNGFNMVKFRESLRNFLQTYGDQILAIVKADA